MLFALSPHRVRALRVRCVSRLARGVFLAAALGASARAAELRVDPAGANGAHRTVQAAIDAAPAGTGAERTVIRIAPGTYHERLTVPAAKTFLTLRGDGAAARDVVLQFDLTAKSPKPGGEPGATVGTTGSASTTVLADDFSAENLTFKNSSADNVAQAVALKTAGDRMVFDRCRFWGFQDTLYATGGRQYFRACEITGDTDFIFGNATAVFDRCTINCSGPGGYYLAPNTAPATPVGFVLLHCTLTTEPNRDVDPATGRRYSTVERIDDAHVFFARPWQYARTRPSATLLHTKLAGALAPVGWHPWDKNNTDPAATTRFAEFGSVDATGAPADVSARAPWAKPLTADDAARYTLENIFGPAAFWGGGFTDWDGKFTPWLPPAASARAGQVLPAGN